MTQAEISVENFFRKALKAMGGRCVKLPAIWYAGIPDRLVLLPGGRVWFIELKKKGAPTTKKVSVHQVAWRNFLQNNGFNYARLVGIEEVKGFLNDRAQDPI
jgi:hypothetical protein